MITIKDIRLNQITIDCNDYKVQGSYDLISDKGKVFAKQTFNGYNDIKVVLSKESTVMLEEFLFGLKDDIEMATGINEAVTKAVKELE